MYLTRGKGAICHAPSAMINFIKVSKFVTSIERPKVVQFQRGSAPNPVIGPRTERSRLATPPCQILNTPPILFHSTCATAGSSAQRIFQKNSPSITPSFWIPTIFKSWIVNAFSDDSAKSKHSAAILFTHVRGQKFRIRLWNADSRMQRAQVVSKSQVPSAHPTATCP